MKEYEKFEQLCALVPKNGTEISWQEFEKSAVSYVLEQMSRTEQNPKYHAEGNVYEHTKYVCSELVKLKEYQQSSDTDKEILFLSALLHDIGKIRCTTVREGIIVSPRHSIAGATMARELLWRELGLCGTYERQQMREAICMLIRYHSYPPFAESDEGSERKILKIASNGELIKDFSMQKLYLLSRADCLGRIGSSKESYIERVEMFKLLLQEYECLSQPYEFASAYSQRAYFLCKTNWKRQELFDNTFGEVIIMCGLPGTGKDTYIKANYPTLPVISLDEIRVQMGISPTDKQGPVIARAHEMAREYLRRKEPFIWNATSLTAQLREMQIVLAESYGARVKVVYLEADWETELERNASRKAEVPRAVIERMLSRFEIPERFECQGVEWICV